jgi:hypothetical protein
VSDPSAGLAERVEANHRRWVEVIDAAGARVDEPGAAGEWTLRDVVAHINAYHRFLVLELGGSVRPFGELREHDGNDMEARNQALHEADRSLTWSVVREELDTVHAALVGEVTRRSAAELDAQMVDWAPMSVREWVLDLTEGHFTEHEADLRAFLAGGTPR